MFFCRKFFSSQCRKIQWGNPSVLCFRTFLVAKIFMDKKGGITRVSVESFLSDSAEKFRSGTLQCVINFGYRKNLCFRGLCNDFLSKIFRLTLPKKLVGEAFFAVFQEISGTEKVFRQERGESNKFFLRNFFSSHSVEKCRRGFLQSFNNFGNGESLEEKVRGESIKIFRWTFLVSQCRNISQGNHLGCH